MGLFDTSGVVRWFQETAAVVSLKVTSYYCFYHVSGIVCQVCAIFYILLWHPNLIYGYEKSLSCVSYSIGYIINKKVRIFIRKRYHIKPICQTSSNDDNQKQIGSSCKRIQEKHYSDSWRHSQIIQSSHPFNWYPLSREIRRYNPSCKKNAKFLSEIIDSLVVACYRKLMLKIFWFSNLYMVVKKRRLYWRPLLMITTVTTLHLH